MAKHYKYVRLPQKKVLHKISDAHYSWSADYTICGITINELDFQFQRKPSNNILCKNCFRNKNRSK